MSRATVAAAVTLGFLFLIALAVSDYTDAGAQKRECLDAGNLWATKGGFVACIPWGATLEAPRTSVDFSAP